MSDASVDPSTGCAPTCSLAEWRPGDAGGVVSIEGDPHVRQRLLEMGLTPGAAVRVVRMAPLGDPMELAVRGYRLSIRRSEAQHVTVRRESTPGPSHDPGAAAAGGR